MSDATGAVAQEIQSGEISDHDRMLRLLDVAVDEAARKIDEGRVRDEEKERVRIKWVRALAYCLNVRRQIVADRDLEELRQEVDELKEERRQRVKA